MGIQDGTYEAKPLPGATLGYTSKGTECVGVEFEFVDPEAITRSISWFGYFSEKTAERTIESLRFCGWRGTDLNDLSEIGQNPDVRVNLVIGSEEYEGKVRSKVQWVNRAGGLAMANPLNEDQRKAFAARMKGAVLSFDQKTGPAPKRAPKNSRLEEDVFPGTTSEKPPF